MVQERGYTLVELALVLTVVSVMAAVVAPDFIAMARNDLAARSVHEITRIVETARWHYYHSDPGDPTRPRTWPTTDTLGRVEMSPDAGSCLQDSTGGCARRVLPDSMLTNPWGRDYDVRIVDDSLVVQTLVPEEVSGVLETRLPGGVCGNEHRYCGFGELPKGFRACCAVVPRPGLDPGLDTLEMNDAMCEGLGGVYDPATRECETLEFDESGPECINVASRRCPNGFVLRGTDVRVRCTMGDWYGESVCMSINTSVNSTCCRNP